MSDYNKPLILGDNYFDDVVLHPDHTVSTTGTEIEGNEVFRVADNLRDLTSFAVTETNTLIDVSVLCTASKPASCFVLDRGHNLKGKTVLLRGDSTTIATCTIPSSPGGLPSDANGCLTSEGVWWKTFASVSHTTWTFRINAMGAGLSPIVTGLYVGDFYRFPEYLNSPAAYDYRINHKAAKNATSEAGVRIKRRIVNSREVNLNLTLEDPDFLGFHSQVLNLLYKNHPWWFCLEDTENVGGADLMGLFQAPGDTLYDPVVDPVHRNIQFSLEEVVPLNIL
jgi:hypothetical protein